MPSKPKQTDRKPEAFVPSGDLDIFGIHAFWEQLQPLVVNASGPVFHLDLSAVGDLDVSGLQTLMALDAALEAKGSVLAMRNVRQEWRDRMSTLGMPRLLERCHEEQPC